MDSNFAFHRFVKEAKKCDEICLKNEIVEKSTGGVGNLRDAEAGQGCLISPLKRNLTQGASVIWMENFYFDRKLHAWPEISPLSIHFTNDDDDIKITFA